MGFIIRNITTGEYLVRDGEYGTRDEAHVFKTMNAVRKGTANTLRSRIGRSLGYDFSAQPWTEKDEAVITEALSKEDWTLYLPEFWELIEVE